MQVVAPTADEYVPAVHAVHPLAPKVAVLNVPVAHRNGQAVACDVMPVPVPYVPATQPKGQDVDPCAAV